MAKNNSHTEPQDLEAALKLSQNLTRVIEECIKYGGISQARFAKDIGLSRSSLNQILRSRSEKHLWRLPQLCAVARVLHVSVTDIFMEAGKEPEEGDMPGGSSLAYRALLYDTTPGSPERLRRLIVQGYRNRAVWENIPDIAEREDFEEIMKCTLPEIEQGAPEFYRAYKSGVYDEVKTEAIIAKAFGYVFEHGGPGKAPFWIGLKSAFRSE